MTPASDISDLAKDFSANFSGLATIAIAHRPRICPFGLILDTIAPDDSVFDIGCGSGFLLLAALKLRQAGQLVGVEVNSGLIEKARLATSAYDPDGQLSLQSAVTLDDWPDRQFDIVTMIDVIHHVPKPIQTEFVEAALARVKPGGKFVYKDMADSPLHLAWANRLHDLVLAKQWINYLPIERLTEICEANGFGLVEHSDVQTLWYGHEFRVFSKSA